MNSRWLMNYGIAFQWVRLSGWEKWSLMISHVWNSIFPGFWRENKRHKPTWASHIMDSGRREVPQDGRKLKAPQILRPASWKHAKTQVQGRKIRVSSRAHQKTTVSSPLLSHRKSEEWIKCRREQFFRHNTTPMLKRVFDAIQQTVVQSLIFRRTVPISFSNHRIL